MGARAGRFSGIDQNIAANLRLHREAAGLSQEELAQRMTDRGFGFSQATIWKIERGQRPVRASELVALADSLAVMSVMSLTCEPGAARHHVWLQQANRNAYDAYQTLKEAAAAYLQARVELVTAAREAHNDGVAVTETHTSWLRIPAEQAAIEARIQTGQEDAQAQQVDDAAGKVLDALRHRLRASPPHRRHPLPRREPRPAPAPASPQGT